MANGEPVEIAALTNNLRIIIDTVTMSGNLPWFADRLVEKRFLPRRASQGILGTFGETPDRQAGKLLDSVFTKLRTVERKRTRKWFDDFVDIFSRDAAYEDLVLALRRSVGEVPVQPAASESYVHAIDRLPPFTICFFFRYLCSQYTHSNT